MTDAMAPMSVPQNYHETLPSGVRLIMLVQFYGLRLVALNDAGEVFYDRLFGGHEPPQALEAALARIRQSL